MWHHLARCNPGVLRNTLASPRALNTFPIATGPVFSRMPFESHLKKMIAKTPLKTLRSTTVRCTSTPVALALKALFQVPEQPIRLGPVTSRTINAPHPLEAPLRSSVEICVAENHVKAYLFPLRIRYTGSSLCILQ